MSPKQNSDNQCQYQTARGHRCRMLIDANHRPANGAASATLCAYHAGRLQTEAPAVDPEVLAAELLEDINGFTTADEVNLFLGNLVRQLVRKRIARRDALALAYISQLILTSQSAMARERAAEEEDESLNFANGLFQRVRALTGDASHADSRFTSSAAAAHPDRGSAP